MILLILAKHQGCPRSFITSGPSKFKDFDAVFLEPVGMTNLSSSNITPHCLILSRSLLCSFLKRLDEIHSEADFYVHKVLVDIRFTDQCMYV